MKNDMKLIMESWRGVIQEQTTYPPDSVFQFLEDLTTSTGSEKSIEEKIVKALKITDDKLDQNKVTKVTKAIAEKGFFLGFGLLVGIATGGFSVILGAALGVLVDSLMSGAYAQVKSLVDVFNIPDADRSQYPTSELWDISDDLIKVLKGPNNEFDRDEFKGVAEVYVDIIKVLKNLKDKQEQMINDNDPPAFRAFLREPISNYLQINADTAAKEKYSTQLSLGSDLTIPKP